ncbi:M23 family metallopeptidase [candidate division KSB1 bacterium]|nr:MAG: M23 family metallopeptidase [candidate division KSB1 bacterium]
MPQRKFKLIYLSHDLTKKVELTLTHRKVRAALLGLAVCFLITNVVAGLVASFLINSRENEALHQENHKLRAQITELETRVAGINKDVSLLAQTDKLLRMMADLPPLDADVQKVGIGGAPNLAPADAELPELATAVWSLDRVEREIDLQRASFEEIHHKLTVNAELLNHTPTIRPLAGGYISSGFGMRRDPFTKRVEPHAGVDIVQPRGTPIMAAAEGQIIYVGRYYSYGKFVVIDHGFGYQTAYGHLNDWSVRQGQYVSKGQVIGSVGSTGRATGSHLHYEVRVNGRPVDPTDYFFEDAATLPPTAQKQ